MYIASILYYLIHLFYKNWMPNKSVCNRRGKQRHHETEIEMPVCLKGKATKASIF